LLKAKYDLRIELKNWFAGSGKVIVAGIGNPIRKDDFVGVKIVSDLQGRVPDSVILIECETVPESSIQEIIELKPSRVLLVDAAILGFKPGEARLISPEHIMDFPAITTHVLPLRIFCDYVTGSTAAKIGLLLIQPGKVEFGEGLSPEVAAAAERITGFLLECFGSKTNVRSNNSLER